MPEMKNSGIKWIGDIPSNWDIEKSKYHFTNKKYIPGVHSVEYDRLALTLKGVVNRSKEDADGLQPKDFNTYQLLEENELVFKLIDLQNVSTSRIGLAHSTGLVSPAYIVLHTKNSILPEYAEKFYLMMWHREIFNALGDNGVRSNLGVSDLLNVSIPVPPLEVQKSIANFLDKKCKEIDTLYIDIEKQISVLENYRNSTITEAVTKGLNPNVQMKDSGIKWIGEIPKHWNVKKIKYITTQRTESKFFNPEEDLYIGLENIKSYSNTLIETGTKYEKSTQAVFKVGDVLFNKLRPYLSKVWLADTEGFCTSELLNFKTFEGNKKFLFYALLNKSFIDVVNASTYGAKMPRANSNFIENLHICIPSQNEQNTIVDFLDKKCSEIDKVIIEKQKQLKTLEKYKKSLIYEYVTGKKEVSENV